MNGVIPINKPGGMTSFQVCAAVRRRLHIKRVGHAGTLDPLATGVLPVLVGNATRIADLLPCDKKQYTASLVLGMTTDTLDCEGQVLTDQPVNVTRAQLKAAVESFLGDSMQLPPMYSALKRNGVALYTLARQGVQVERTPRKITVYSIKLLDYNECDFTAKIEICCSKGSYIRSIIDDLGVLLGCGAYMNALCRDESGGFSLEDCISLDEVDESAILPADRALAAYAEVKVTPAQAKRFVNGGELNIDRLSAPPSNTVMNIYRVYGEQLLGLGIIKGDTLAPKWIKK